MSEKIRLGGMALPNGVLVHGPTSWACAVRTDAGEIELGSGRKPVLARNVKSPFLRGPAKMAELFVLLAAVRRALPEAKAPYERADVAAAMLGSVVVIRGLRGSALQPVVRESLAALFAFAPTAVALQGTALAAYHGAEHITIGSYEHDEPRPREHERCGSHLVGPLVATSALGSFLASLTPSSIRPLARAGAAIGAVGAAVEVFGWMLRNERHPLARALARPGHELQHRLVTAEPTAAQLEVAETALRECLRLEGGTDGDRDDAEAPPT